MHLGDIFRFIVITFLLSHTSNVLIYASDKNTDFYNRLTLSAAGVLPILKNDTKQLQTIIGQEKDHGYDGSLEYDYFAGGGNDNDNSFDVAVREFSEEARLNYVWKNQCENQSDIKEYIKKNVVGLVISTEYFKDNNIQRYGVMYIVNIDQSYKQSLMENFNSAKVTIEQENLEKKQKEALLEKEKLIVCSYGNLLSYPDTKLSKLDIIESSEETNDSKPIQLRTIFSTLLKAINDDSNSPTIYDNQRFNLGVHVFSLNKNIQLNENEKNDLYQKVLDDLGIEDPCKDRSIVTNTEQKDAHAYNISGSTKLIGLLCFAGLCIFIYSRFGRN